MVLSELIPVSFCAVELIFMLFILLDVKFLRTKQLYAVPIQPSVHRAPSRKLKGKSVFRQYYRQKFEYIVLQFAGLFSN